MNTYKTFDTITLHDAHTCVNIYTNKFFNTYQDCYTRPKMAHMSAFGDNLRKVREAAGLTQEQLAEMLGMLRTNYVKLETKGKAGRKLMERIASIKELKVDYNTLKAWQAMGSLEPEVIAKIIEFTDKERGIN